MSLERLRKYVRFVERMDEGFDTYLEERGIEGA
jgi:hypothetical protein